MSFCRMMSRLCGSNLHDVIVRALGWQFYGCSIVVGFVTDSVTHAEVEDASVTLFRNVNGTNETIETQLTDADGIVVFYGLKHHTDYRIRISKPGYDSALDLTSFSTDRCSYVFESREITPTA